MCSHFCFAPYQVLAELGQLVQRHGTRIVKDDEGKDVEETMATNVWVPVDNLLAVLVKDIGLNPVGEKGPHLCASFAAIGCRCKWIEASCLDLFCLLSWAFLFSARISFLSTNRVLEQAGILQVLGTHGTGLLCFSNCHTRPFMLT